MFFIKSKKDLEKFIKETVSDELQIREWHKKWARISAGAIIRYKGLIFTVESVGQGLMKLKIEGQTIWEELPFIIDNVKDIPDIEIIKDRQ